ncbi:MAG TPA: VWA domain-containing protein [Bacteroidales bacterium]|nr:VWA domain-containing protein [Bacteroidales bacterium]
MNIKTIIAVFFCVLIISYSSGQSKARVEDKIQIALLLDVSGSMDNLLSQAKGQIWRMVNELSKAQKNNQKPIIQIALGTFGNGAFGENGYFHLYTPLTSDIDSISENLYSLTTGGNLEYCGFAINFALDSLAWSKNKNDLKLIFIAGNEPFNQGSIDYISTCKKAVKKNILVNTIYCGDEKAGIKDLWEDGAKTARGKYMVINQDSLIKYGETFWDKKIIEYNDKLNKTYIPYGLEGEKWFQRLLKQDENVLSFGNAFMRERVVYKASNNYQNILWDLVDAYMNDSTILNKIKLNDLPDKMKSMTTEKKKQYLEQKNTERELYKEGINTYYIKAQEFIKTSTGNEDASVTLDNAIIKTIIEQATKKDFIFR